MDTSPQGTMENLTRPVQRLSQEEFEHIKFLKHMKSKNLEHGKELQKSANGAIIGLLRNMCLFFGFLMVHYLRNSGCNALFYFTALGLLGVLTFCVPICIMIESMSKQVDWLVNNDKILRMHVDLLASNIRDNIEIVQVGTDLSTLVAHVRLFPRVLDHGKSISLLASLKKLVIEPSAPTNFKICYMMLVAILFLLGISFSLGMAAISYGPMCGHENSGLGLLGVLTFCLPTYSMIESMSKQVDWLVDNDRILRMRVDLLANNIRDNIEIVQVATDLGGGPPTLVANVRLFSQVFYRGKSISLLESLKEFVSEPSVPTNFKFHYMMVVAILYLFGISYFFGVAATLYGTMCGHENSGKNNIGNLDFKLLQPT